MLRCLLKLFPVVLAISGYGMVPNASAQQHQTPQPNVLLIMLDDFGYNDLGANGNTETPTPNLDALAAQGVLYTRHYADASCSVARVAMMTGTFPAVNGIRPTHLGLSPGTPTIASMLSESGYRTQHIGKWHVVNATLAQSPSQLGFDDWYGFLHNRELGGPSTDGIQHSRPTYFKPWLRDNQAPLEQQKGHLTDILTKRAIGFLDDQKEQSQPWFLNLWYFAPHAPIQPAPRFRKTHPDTKKGRYHALIDQLDFNIGRLMKALANSGAADNTLVIVVSDNGGTNSAVDSNYPFFGRKTELYEGGLRTPFFMRWPGHIEPETVSDEIVSLYDIFPTIAQASSATLPPGLIGRSLFDPDRAEPPALFWEYSNSEMSQYSALSSDGRWRLTNFWGSASLYDLHATPSGKGDVLERYPEVGAQLIADYLQWHKRVRKVSVDYESLNTRGGAVLRQADLLRSPGYAGFTFAIGVTPKAEASGEPEVIAEQVGRWRLQSSESGALELTLLGQSVVGPALPIGRCSEVVVTTQFNFSPSQPEINSSIIDLYINGVRANSATLKGPALKTSDYDNPTYLGMNAAREEQYQGKLSKPLILNERVVPDSKGAITGNGISGLPVICPATSPLG